MSHPKRILHFQGRMGKGGAETFMMNAYRNIDRSKFQFDFLIYNDFKDVKTYNQEIHHLGGKIYSVPNPKKNIIGYIKAVNDLLKEKHFDIVHSEVFFGGGLNLWLANQAGIKKRIVHSHATSDGKGNHLVYKGIRKVFDKLMKENATDYLACSNEAGIALYGNEQPFIFVPNGIDLEKYQNVTESKKDIRKKLNIGEDNVVIGNIGRFEEQKNHRFLIDIFQSVLKKQPNATLLLIGEGSLLKEIKQIVKEKKMENHVQFLGSRDDIPELLKAMDVFLMPSLYEGLPISAVEAQAAKLKLVLSDEVSKETKLSKNVQFLSLNQSSEEWAAKVLEEPYTNEPLPSLSQYDMKKTAEQLEKIYEK
ncbi:glycosyltransferase family 1 protein [Pisciglobus halotolerans]|uniref:Glycosyltransferase involved in cell wall bisynthesis n=1 Tax=Pisciglobus halotolerans TaxID=745365 RepID=A0A1I3CPN2_9LACT|nr:glycosyltransferase family 1 protein [Pisciglobus halotolerans]SFH76540.1 Glycosyltransferase involved in cell wall bisynthesis [Pisciglobus halotolerans]